MIFRCVFVLLWCLIACENGPRASVSATFEIRDFATKENITAETAYSAAWNDFSSFGTLVAKGVPTDRASMVLLEVKDLSDGPNPEPQYEEVLVRGGTGKIEIAKSRYGKFSKRPDYRWTVVGWHELAPGTIKFVN